MVNWLSNNFDLVLEIVAVIFGIAYVLLAAKNKISCWIFGIIGSALSIFLFIFYAKLYAESVLYLFYVFAGVYGWINWKNQKDNHQVFQHKLKTHLFIIIGGTIATLLFYFTMTYFFSGAKKPLTDSFTTIFSFIATYLTTKKRIENWIYWVVIDAVTTYLYYSRGLEIYSLLMLSYSFIAIYGYLKWKKLDVVKL
ncbi:MAG: hypothetical protein A3K10_11580 [Bacteroidetes bacterium RIFCSPLOWO2_12_FULL_31_6]|nr:MAG: hypothetical protein A3K10_11580 [Bacteroidetes bacterium RIFCSPLOWO2_12_FULL_31_6]